MSECEYIGIDCNKSDVERWLTKFSAARLDRCCCTLEEDSYTQEREGGAVFMGSNVNGDEKGAYTRFRVTYGY